MVVNRVEQINEKQRNKKAKYFDNKIYSLNNSTFK